MTKQIYQIADNFWYIRGSFKIGGVVEIGTHASLVKRANGKFNLLDSLSLTRAQKKKIGEITGGGALVEAILNLHPFHTLHVRAMHKKFPDAALFGTSRHIERDPDLPWQKLQTDDHKLHALFAEDFDFSAPKGVDFISDNEKVHFSSVLAYHRGSKTIHVDDTLMCFRLPAPIRAFARQPSVSFHPTLASALEKRSGAAADFQKWAEEIIERWKSAENLCTAHNWFLTEKPGAIHMKMVKALGKTKSTLRAHTRMHQ